MPEPPRRVERPGRDAISVPVSRPRSLESPVRVVKEPEPSEPLAVPVATLASATESLPGTIEAPSAPPTLAQGPGRGGGAGSGSGTGDGPGGGSGLGPGRGGGMGDGVYLPGNGVTPPVEIRKGLPRYTGEAMRARIQGAVLVSCVVQTSGMCTDIRVLRSLTPAFGLDDEAIKAAEQWRFRPGTRLGSPVPVRVTMEIAFALR